MKAYKVLLAYFKKKNSYFLSILFSSSLTLCRLFSNLNSVHYFQIFPLILIFVQLALLLIHKKWKTTKCKFLMNILTISSHIIMIYFTPYGGSDVLLGIDASIILFQNFRKIAHRTIRILLLLVFAFFFFLKDYSEINESYLFYYVCVLTIFEKIANSNSKKSIKNMGKALNKQSREIIKNESFSNSVRRSNINNTKKKQDYAKMKSSLAIPVSSCVSINMINLINIGVAKINTDLDLTFGNNYLFNLFKTQDLRQIKEILFSLEENLEIQQSDFQRIPDLDLPKFFHKSCIFGESMGSFKIDEHNETSEIFKANKFPTISKYMQTVHSMQDEIRFENWKKRCIDDNMQEKFKAKTEKKRNPKSVLNYLIRLNDYCSKKNELNYKKTEDQIKPEKNNAGHENYSMFATLIIGENDKKEEKIVLVNFIPLSNAKENLSQSEILISIRTLSDMEIKYMDYNYAKNRILGSFCHELRTPINSIINTLDMMQQSQTDEALGYFNSRDENLMNATISSHLLLNEIDDFIDYFSYCNDMLEANPVPFEINTFFQEIQRIFTFFAMKKNLGFSVDIEKNVPITIYNDEKRMRQVIFNLLNNSIRFTSTGSIRITVKLRKENTIEIQVLDTGCGMKLEDLKSLGCINQNYNSADRTTCGFGLFISNILSHLLVNNCNDEKEKGGITVYSENGKGSCFIFKMKNDLGPAKADFFASISTYNDFNKNDYKKTPNLSPDLRNIVSKIDWEKKNQINLFISNKMDKGSPTSFGKGSISNRSILNNKIGFEQACKKSPFYFLSNLKMEQCQCPRILIVDDVPFNIEVCKKLISKRKIPNESANNGVEAVGMIQKILENGYNNKFCSDCGFYKLILMDIDMPFKNGIETTEIIMRLLQDFQLKVTIVGLSAFNQEDIKKKGLNAGMREYVENQ